jgi:hypothetical protein
MDIIQVGLQKLNIVKARVTMYRSPGDGRRNLICLDKCPSYTLKFVSTVIWNTLKPYTLPQQKMSDCILLHVTSIYESLQNYNILLTAPMHSYIRHLQEDNTNMDCKLGVKHLILKGTIACVMEQAYNQTFSPSLLKYMTRQYELLLLLTCSSTHTKLRLL